MIHANTHTHAPQKGLVGFLKQLLHIGGHSHGDTPSKLDDAAFRDNQLGIRTVWLALLLLSLTSLLQIGIFALSGSVALLSDTVHNIGDALNSIPLLVAFYWARRVATRRYTYGYGRAEDIAGLFIVLSIVVSAFIVFWESGQKLFNPQSMQNVPFVVLAAIIGFIGNESVAWLQIRVGRKIGSEAMVIDGLHARTDGLTSLAVLVAAFGTLAGIPILDPIIGLVIGVTILFIARDSIKSMWYRLMDAVDPTLVTRVEHFVSDVKGVKQVSRSRLRWVGHQLFGEMQIVLDEQVSLAEAHAIRKQVISRVREGVPVVAEMTLEVVPRYEVEAATSAEQSAAMMLPPRYQDFTPTAAPMGAAALEYDAEGQVAWDEIWTGFCDLALAGGPSHRGTLLEPVNPAIVALNPSGYQKVLAELRRGITLVTGRNVVESPAPGWIGMKCDSEDMALWLLRTIIVENVTVRREGNVLYFPAGPAFQVEKEIKNIITVIAKTNHYWQEHIAK
jgi:cation diffusion facilitator family transporter